VVENLGHCAQLKNLSVLYFPFPETTPTRAVSRHWLLNKWLCCINVLNLATTKPSEHWRRSLGFLRQRCIGIS